MPAKHRPSGGKQANKTGRQERSWRWYVDEDSEPDPVELVRALGLSTASQTTLQSDLYEQIYEALLVDELQHLATELETAPTPKDMQTYGGYPPADYVHLFGSWTEALSTADIPTDPQTIERARSHSGRVRVERFPPWLHSPVGEEELLEELRQFATTLGGIPKAVDMQKFGRYTVRDYIQHFGSWQRALKQAGLMRPHRSRQRVDPDRLAFTPLPEQSQDGQPTRELRWELRRLAAEIGVTPTPTDMEKFGVFAPRQYHDQFGDWETALAAAGLAPPDTDVNNPSTDKLRQLLTTPLTWAREFLRR